MNGKIYVTLSSFAKENDVPLKLLEDSGHPFEINQTGKRFDQSQLVAAAKGCVGVVAGLETYDADVLSELTDLRCISRCGVGIDNIDLEKAKEAGITVLNTPDVVIQPVAELTVAFAFDLLRKVTQQTLTMKQKQWKRISGCNLRGKTIGILGLGRIGRRVAELFCALQVKVIGTDLVPDEAWAKEYNVSIMDTDQVLAKADIVSIHMTHLEENPFQLSKEHFVKMKKGAMLINAARGSFVNEDDLYDALTSGQLAAAALDVYQKEPYEGPLASLDNVILTPHIGTQTLESRVEMECQAVNNLLNFLKA